MENDEKSMKKFDADTNRWKQVSCLYIRRINVVKMTKLTKMRYRFGPYKNTNDIFHRTRANNSKICMETQKTVNKQDSVEKEKARSIMLPNFKLPQSMSSKLYSTGKRTYKLNRTESLEINPHLYGLLTCDKGGNNCEKTNTPMSSWNNRRATCKKKKKKSQTEPLYLTIHKNKFKLDYRYKHKT